MKQDGAQYTEVNTRLKWNTTIWERGLTHKKRLRQGDTSGTNEYMASDRKWREKN